MIVSTRDKSFSSILLNDLCLVLTLTRYIVFLNRLSLCCLYNTLLISARLGNKALKSGTN